MRNAHAVHPPRFFQLLLNGAKRYSGLTVLLAALFLVLGQMPSQAQQADEPSFFILDYMKVKPGQYGRYLDLEKKVWKKIHQERMKQGKITGWWLYSVRYPGGTDTEYDFITVNRVKGWNAIDSFYNGWGNAYRVLSKEEAAFADSTEMIRDLVRTEVLSYEGGAFKPDFEKNPPHYLVINYMDVPEGKWEGYMAMETKLIKPMQEAEIKAGKRAGWGIYGVVFPYGANQRYDVTTVDFYDKWEDMGSGNAQEALKAIHPGMSMRYFVDQIESARTLVRADVAILEDELH